MNVSEFQLPGFVRENGKAVIKYAMYNMVGKRKLFVTLVDDI